MPLAPSRIDVTRIPACLSIDPVVDRGLAQNRGLKDTRYGRRRVASLLASAHPRLRACAFWPGDWHGDRSAHRRRGLDTGRRTMKAIVVMEQAAGTAGMKLMERPEPQPAINDVVVQIHASGFVPTEMEWPSTW